MRVIDPGYLHWEKEANCSNEECEARLVVEDTDLVLRNDKPYFRCSRCGEYTYISGFPGWLSKRLWSGVKP